LPRARSGELTGGSPLVAIPHCFRPAPRPPKRGKFFRMNAVLDPPVYLGAGVRGYLTARAKAKGLEVKSTSAAECGGKQAFCGF